MNAVLSQLNTSYQNQKPTYESLGNIVKSINVESINFEELLPKIEDESKYARNILQLNPVECVLLHWPASVESAIHYHAGFWGYVMVLEGICDNITYKLSKGKLTEYQALRAIKGGVIDEPDGTIHKIINPSKDQPLVTMHLYHPALENLNNLTLYSEDGTVGVLNEKADTASFDEPKGHFESIHPKALIFQDYKSSPNAKSHRIYPIIPKPDKTTINKMIGAYYCEQAEQYDLFDFNHSSRRKYTEKINKLIAEDIKQSDNIDDFLALACGTGRRPLHIKELSGQEFDITGVDLSPGMCDVAKSRGLKMYQGDWLDVSLNKNDYDICTFLYAFGHITCHEERVLALKKIHNSLKSGGMLYFDVFNINDKYEWGNKAVDRHTEFGLDQWGYERGDIFYKKTEGEEIAFLHYFDQSKLEKLLNECGFKVERVDHIGYVHRSGELLDAPDEGSFFVKATTN